MGSYKPDGYTTVSPYLIADGATATIELTSLSTCPMSTQSTDAPSMRERHQYRSQSRNRM